MHSLAKNVPCKPLILYLSINDVAVSERGGEHPNTYLLCMQFQWKRNTSRLISASMHLVFFSQIFHSYFHAHEITALTNKTLKHFLKMLDALGGL